MSTRDYSSIYDIKDFFINNLAPNYFDNIDDVSKLNVGLLGLITSINATTTEDTFNTISVYLNEMLPSQATLPEIIYAYAAQYGIDNIFAKCATMPVIITIKESDILENATVQSNGSMIFVIDKDLQINVTDIPFSIPYDIIITAHPIKNNGEVSYSYTATYDNDINNSVANIDSPYMKIIRITSEGMPFLGIKTTAYQYTKKEYNESIISNNKLNIPSFDYGFENDICNFEAVYTAASTGKSTQCIKLLDTSLPSKSPSCFYKMRGSENDETLHISFATDDRYFIPEYNSDLTVYIYETLGEQGNFPHYTGDDVEIITSSSTYDYNNSISMFCIIAGASTGGSNRLSLTDIKRLMLTKRTTDSSYTTENDLNAYFLNYTSIYGTVCKFYKPRDDYSSREYKCYSRLVDNDIIYPTNTVTISTQSDNRGLLVNDNNYTILSGTKLIYDGDSNEKCVIINDDTDSSHEYICPFQVQITMSPNNVGCYLTSIDKDIEVDYTLSNGQSLHQFTASTFHIYRNSNISSNYDISFLFSLADFTTVKSEENTIDYNNISVIVYFPDDMCYISLELDDTRSDISKMMYMFKGTMTTNGIMHNNSMQNSSTIEITNMKSLDWASGSALVTKNIDKMNPNMKICILYKYGESNSTPYSINSLSGYTVTNEFTPTNDSGMYFAYPMTLVKPTMSFTDLGIGTTEFGIDIAGLPVVSASILDNESTWFNFVNKIESQHEYMMNIRNDITAGFTLNMKFYNTYGRSRLFTINDNHDLLNRTDCKFKIAVKFENGVEPDDYIDNIKATIKTVLEQANDIDNGYNEFHSSSIITTLATNFPQIQYVVVNSINDYGSDIQTITMDTTLYDNANTIPEFLTIDMDDIDVTVK